MKKDRKNLRWGYSTGACAAAAAKAAWIRLTRGGAPQSIWVHFPLAVTLNVRKVRLSG